MYHTIKRWDKNEKRPNMEEVVIGFDEWEKTERKVQYRSDSNRFFDYPYTGAVYGIDRMHLWRPLKAN